MLRWLIENMARKTVFIQEWFNKIFKVFLKFKKIDSIIIAVICWVIVIIGSLIHDFHRPPEFYLSNKRNIFNVLFAKWCLAWSLAFLVPFVVFSSMVKSMKNLEVVFRNVIRLIVSFIIWFVVTTILEYIEDLTGNCEGSDLYSGKQECVREGLLWRGFDISGHSFLLTYCSLIISEEIRTVSETNKKTNSKLEQELVIYRRLGNLLYICCCMLMMLWMVLLVSTAIYFHTVETKVIGVILGISSWYFTYRVFFLSKSFPGVAPGF